MDDLRRIFSCYHVVYFFKEFSHVVAPEFKLKVLFQFNMSLFLFAFFDKLTNLDNSW